MDYVGVFKSLEKALAIYGSGTGGDAGEGEKPIREKSELVEDLKKIMSECTVFCRGNGIDVVAVEKSEPMERISLLDDAVEALVKTDDIKKGFLNLADQVERLYKAVMPDPEANAFAGKRGLFKTLAKIIRSLSPPVDITGIMNSVEELLDQSISTEGYVIADPPKGYDKNNLVDLSRIDFEALKKQFEKGRKNTETEKVKGSVARKLRQMVRLNRSRMDYLEKFQNMIDEYNAGSVNIDEFFRRLMEFAQELNDEEKRAISEQLSEEELALFDLLTKPEPDLNNKEKKQVKKTARDLLNMLKREKLVLDWRKRQQSRAEVRVTVEKILDRGLPEVYTEALFQQKTESVFQHLYESYYGAGKGIYTVAT